MTDIFAFENDTWHKCNDMIFGITKTRIGQSYCRRI